VDEEKMGPASETSEIITLLCFVFASRLPLAVALVVKKR